MKTALKKRDHVKSDSSREGSHMWGTRKGRKGPPRPLAPSPRSVEKERPASSSTLIPPSLLSIPHSFGRDLVLSSSSSSCSEPRRAGDGRGGEGYRGVHSCTHSQNATRVRVCIRSTRIESPPRGGEKEREKHTRREEARRACSRKAHVGTRSKRPIEKSDRWTRGIRE